MFLHFMYHDVLCKVCCMLCFVAVAAGWKMTCITAFLTPVIVFLNFDLVFDVINLNHSNLPFYHFWRFYNSSACSTFGLYCSFSHQEELGDVLVATLCYIIWIIKYGLHENEKLYVVVLY